MRREQAHMSFTAYAGTDEGPQAAVRAIPHPRRRPVAETQAKASGLRLLVLSLVLLASSAALLRQHSDVLLDYINRPISSVRLETALYRVQEQDMRAVLAMHLDDGFFGLDTGALKRQLEEHPWVEQAVIRRVWPDVLALSIHEETPIARWGSSQLLNQSAEVFEPPNIAEDLALPMLEGPVDSQQQVMEQYQIFSQLLLGSGLRIQKLSLDRRGGWSVVANNGLQINIGREQVMERLQRFITFYDSYMHEDLANLAAIDLRYRNGISVKKRDEAASGVAAL